VNHLYYHYITTLYDPQNINILVYNLLVVNLISVISFSLSLSLTGIVQEKITQEEFAMLKKMHFSWDFVTQQITVDLKLHPTFEE
jgi:hypothetical protein